MKIAKILVGILGLVSSPAISGMTVNEVGPWQISFDGKNCVMVGSDEAGSSISIEVPEANPRDISIFIRDNAWRSLQPGGSVKLLIGQNEVPSVEVPGPHSGFMGFGTPDYATIFGNLSIEQLRNNSITLNNKGRDIFFFRFQGNLDDAAFDAVQECIIVAAIASAR